MKKFLHLAGNIVSAILIVIMILAVILAVQGRRNPDGIASVMGYKMLTVLSGSMSPAFEPGDVIVVAPPKGEIKQGDVITFREKSVLVTHRIAEIAQDGSSEVFKTKGDANNVEDDEPVDRGQIVGKYMFRIPYGGYVARFARSMWGFILLIAVPAVLLLAGELKNVFAILKDENKNHTV